MCHLRLRSNVALGLQELDKILDDALADPKSASAAAVDLLSQAMVLSRDDKRTLPVTAAEVLANYHAPSEVAKEPSEAEQIEAVDTAEMVAEAPDMPVMLKAVRLLLGSRPSLPNT